MVERPQELDTRTIRKRTGCGKAYITVTTNKDGYKEIFAMLGKSGGCAACNISSLTRTITLAWNYGAPLEKIIKQLNGATCPSSGGLNLSCPQAIADVLKTQLPTPLQQPLDQASSCSQPEPLPPVQFPEA